MHTDKMLVVVVCLAAVVVAAMLKQRLDSITTDVEKIRAVLAEVTEERDVLKAEVAGFAANMETTANKLQAGMDQMSPDNPNRNLAAGVVQLHRLYGMWADRLANGLVTHNSPIHAKPGFCQDIE